MTKTQYPDASEDSFTDEQQMLERMRRETLRKEEQALERAREH